jgi:hypothetical protein
MVLVPHRPRHEHLGLDIVGVRLNSETAARSVR